MIYLKQSLKTLSVAALGVAMLAPMFTTPAEALSCMRPDVMYTMEEAKKSDKVYYILVGQFTPVQPIKKPKIDYNFQHPIEPVQTGLIFNGYGLSPGRARDIRLDNYPVTAEISCAASWCGGLPDENSSQIAFVEARQNAAPLLSLGACPMWTIREEPGQVDALKNCFDKSCAPVR